MSDRTRLGLVACLITFATCVLPLMILLWASAPRPKPSAESRPQTASQVPSRPWLTREQIEDGEAAAAQIRAQNASIKESLDRHNQEQMLKRVIDYSRRR